MNLTESEKWALLLVICHPNWSVPAPVPPGCCSMEAQGGLCTSETETIRDGERASERVGGWMEKIRMALFVPLLENYAKETQNAKPWPRLQYINYICICIRAKRHSKSVWWHHLVCGCPNIVLYVFFCYPSYLFIKSLYLYLQLPLFLFFKLRVNFNLPAQSSIYFLMFLKH